MIIFNIIRNNIINFLINENIYSRSRLNSFKFDNFDIPLLKFADP